MNCQEVTELMQRHVDGDLDQQETALMTAHVGGCPECAVMLERLQRLSDDLSQLPRVEPRFSIVDAIMPQLNQLESERLNQSQSAQDQTDTQVVVPPIRSERPRGRLLRRWSGIVAAGVVAGLLLMSQQLQLSNGDSDNDAAAPSEFGNSALRSEDQSFAMMLEDGDAPAEAPQAGAAEPSSSAKMAPTESMSGEAGQEAPVASEQATVNGSAASVAEPGISSFDVADQYGANAVVTPTSESEEGAMSKASGADSMEYSLSAQATSLVSPDGQWRAVAFEGDGTLRIYATKDDSLVFESKQRAGSLTSLTWDQESKQLTYTWIDEQGHSTNYAYNADEMLEITP